MTDRQYLLLRALLRTLEAAGKYLSLAAHIRNEMSLAVPRMTQSEFDATLSAADREGYLTSVTGPRGPQYRLSSQGEAWLIDNAN